MSWSTSIEKTSKATATVDTAEAVANLSNLSDAAYQQASRTAAFAATILQDPTTLGGQDNSLFNVSLAGHVHEGNGSAADCISIYVSRVLEEVAPEPIPGVHTDPAQAAEAPSA